MRPARVAGARVQDSTCRAGLASHVLVSGRGLPSRGFRIAQPDRQNLSAGAIPAGFAVRSALRPRRARRRSAACFRRSRSSAFFSLRQPGGLAESVACAGSPGFRARAGGRGRSVRGRCRTTPGAGGPSFFPANADTAPVRRTPTGPGASRWSPCPAGSHPPCGLPFRGRRDRAGKESPGRGPSAGPSAPFRGRLRADAAGGRMNRAAFGVDHRHVGFRVFQPVPGFFLVVSDFLDRRLRRRLPRVRRPRSVSRARRCTREVVW